MKHRYTDAASDTAAILDISETDYRLVSRSRIDYRDKFRGAMVGTGIGDALGRPVEGMTPDAIRAAFGVLDLYVSGDPNVQGSPGRLTDDTEMTLCIAQSVVGKGTFDVADIAERFRVWLPSARGIGAATWAACDRLEQGVPWFQSGSASAGNGAAMRVTSLALTEPFEVNELRRITAWSSIITHADPTAVASAIVAAYVVAHLLHTRPRTLDLDELLAGIDRALDGVNDPALPQRRTEETMTLRQRIHDVFDMRDEPITEIYAVTGNGSFVMESLPAALAAFVVNRGNATLTVVDAVGGGYDADTVGAMAGMFAGAYNGYSAFPGEWISGLEFESGLRGLADELAHKARLARRFKPDRSGNKALYRPTIIDGERWITEAHVDAAREAPDIACEVRLQPVPLGALHIAFADRRW